MDPYAPAVLPRLEPATTDPVGVPEHAATMGPFSIRQMPGLPFGLSNIVAAPAWALVAGLGLAWLVFGGRTRL